MRIIKGEKLSPIEMKLRYLAKIVWTYRRFSKHFENVVVTYDKGEVTINWVDPFDHEGPMHDFESVSFPITRLDQRIDTYKDRLEYAFKYRHDPNRVVKFKR